MESIIWKMATLDSNMRKKMSHVAAKFGYLSSDIYFRSRYIHFNCLSHWSKWRYQNKTSNAYISAVKIGLKKFQCNTSLLRNNVKKLQLPITTLIFFKEYFEYTFINFFRIYILMDNEKLNVQVNLWSSVGCFSFCC